MTNTRWLLPLSLVLLAFLASCSGPAATPPADPAPPEPGPVTPTPPETPSAPDGPTLSGTVYIPDYDPATLTLVALGYNNSEDLFAPIAEAPVAAEGVFSLTLPATLNPQHDAIGLFQSHDCPRGTGSFEVSPNPVQFAWIFDLRVRRGNDELGFLYRVIDISATHVVLAQKVYVVADTTIEGTCVEEVELEDGSTITQTVTSNLTFKAGWNDVLQTRTWTEDRLDTIDETVEEVPAGDMWLFEPSDPPSSRNTCRSPLTGTFGTFCNSHPDRSSGKFLQ